MKKLFEIFSMRFLRRTFSDCPPSRIGLSQRDKPIGEKMNDSSPHPLSPAETGMGNREGNRVERCSEREISPLAYYDTKQYLDI